MQVIADAPFPQGTNRIPIVPAPLQSAFTVSGYQINQLRVSYTAADDTLNVGVEGPLNGRDGREVIAGDADNNGNSGTVNPSVTAIDPAFQDPADMGGTETYGVSLAFGGSTTPSVVAGFPINAPGASSKPYQVALSVPQADASALPLFDEANVLPQYAGNYYLANDPDRPNFELQIAHFSQLYQQVTGQAFSANSQVSLGAFGASLQSAGLTEEVFPPQAVSIPQITVTPPTPTVCPPVSPPVFVNPHENYHINTAHPSAVRVNILGSSGFDPTTIIPSTVRLGSTADNAATGASPTLNYERNVNNDQFADETFVFNGLDIKLPSGITEALVTGQTTSGQAFASTVRVFNRDATFYTPAQLAAQQRSWARYDRLHGIDTSNGLVAPPVKIPEAAIQRANSAAINDIYHPFAGKKVPTQVNPSATNPVSATTGGKAYVAASVKIPTRASAAKSSAKAKASEPESINLATLIESVVAPKAKSQPKVAAASAASKARARAMTAAANARAKAAASASAATPTSISVADSGSMTMGGSS